MSSRFAGVPQQRRVLGAQGAPYTLVVFADLQCPFCALFDRDVLPSLIARYVRPGKLRVELRLIAFLGTDSGTAAAAAAAAALQDHLWEFADLVYRNQGAENSGYVTPGYLGRLASAVPGLDFRRFTAASGTTELLTLLEEDARAARTAGVRATPSFRLGRTGATLTPFAPRSNTRAVFLAALRDRIEAERG